MPTNPGGAFGSLEYSNEERRKLAIKSREAPPKYGTAERQKLIDEVSTIGHLFFFFPLRNTAFLSRQPKVFI